MSGKPDCSKIDASKCIDKEFPGGDAVVEAGELRVSIGRRAYDEIRKHAAEETDREICGVLLGDLCKDATGPYLHITEIIRGEHTASQGAQVTITHETWNHFHKVKDSKFADKQYLGWYHSHPDFGIFLSSMDLFIHENFFSAPHQVALVVDPLRREEGVFVWRDGKAERAGRFWVGREVHKFEPEPEPSKEERSLTEIEKKLERLRSQVGELDAAVRERPDPNWLQTVLLFGIVLVLGAQAVLGLLKGREQQVADIEDAFRRAVLKVDLDAGKRMVELKLRLPADLRPVETHFNPVSGEVEEVYRLGIDEMAGKYLRAGEKAEGEREKAGAADRKGDGGRPKEGGESTPAGGGADAGTAPVPPPPPTPGPAPDPQEGAGR